MRVVLDTNVLLSGLAYPHSLAGRILSGWKRGSVEVVLSTFILEELRRVLPRLATIHQLTVNEMDDLVDVLSFQADIIEPVDVPAEICRDANDTPILGTLVAAVQNDRADWLVSGDKDLLVLANRYPVLTVAQFCERYGI